MAKKIRIEGKDVDTAIAQGLKELGLRRDQAEVSVLERPTKGFLGIGSKPAVVEVRQKRWQGGDLDAQIYMDVPKKRDQNRGGRRDKKENKFNKKDKKAGPKEGRKHDRKHDRKEEEPKMPKANEAQLLPPLSVQNAVIPDNLKAPMEEAKTLLSKLLVHMGIKVENMNVWWDAPQQRILLTFDCDHPAIVIGKEGKTLEAVQYLMTLALSRHFATPISVMADTQNYWRKVEDKLNNEIERGVAAIKRGAKVYRLRPMPAQMRRFVHRALENNELIETASEGEDKWRKVVLRERADSANKEADAQAETACHAIQEVPASEPETVVIESAAVMIVDENANVIVEEKTETVTVSETTPAAEENPPCACAGVCGEPKQENAENK